MKSECLAGLILGSVAGFIGIRRSRSLVRRRRIFFPDRQQRKHASGGICTGLQKDVVGVATPSVGTRDRWRDAAVDGAGLQDLAVIPHPRREGKSIEWLDKPAKRHVISLVRRQRRSDSVTAGEENQAARDFRFWRLRLDIKSCRSLDMNVAIVIP
jgi:hypothetical protein